MAGQLKEALSQAFGKEADTAPRPRQEGIREDEFLSMADLVPVTQEAAHRELDRLISEMDELISGNRWEDMVSIFHPVDEKQPEMVEHGLDAKLRSRVAFALGQLKRDIRYAPLGIKTTYRRLILHQARHFGDCLEHPEKTYQPFSWGG